MTKDNKRNKKNTLLIVVLVVAVLIIAVLTGVIVKLVISKDSEENEVRRNVVINETNVEEAVSQMVEEAKKNPVSIGSYEVTMNSTWRFKDGSSASENAYVKNATSNTNSVYFDVILSDTQEVILESPILPVGTYLDGITLDKVLPAGEYSCICTYFLLDDNEQPVREVSVTLKIIINN